MNTDFMPRPLFNRSFLPEITVLIIILLVFTDLIFGAGILQGLSMSLVVAITFIVCTASKLFFENADKNKKLLLAARGLAFLTVLIGIAGIIALLFNVFPVNHLRERASENVIGSENDMVLITAFCFTLLGVALYRITLYNAEKVFLSHMLSLIILFIALLSAIAYFFHENTFYRIAFYKPMGIITAICFSLLAFSILRVNKRKGFIGDIISEHQGGKIARLLIPMAIVVPVILGFFQLRTEKAGLYTHPYDIALLTLARIIILVLFVWRTAIIINRSNKAVIAEIEERKKNEEILKYRTALLEAQNEAIPDAILVVDTAGKIISYNHHFTDMWRIPQQIITEGDYTAALKFAITQLEDSEDFIKRVNYIYAHPQQTAHDEILFKDGRIIERHANAIVGDDGTKYGWAWYFRDITLNKKYENKIENFNKELEAKIKERTGQLIKSEKRFRSLVENANDIISLSDEKGIRFYISPAIERITGYSIEETINQPVFNIVHPDDIEKAKNMREQFMREPGVLKPMSFRFMKKNGGCVWMEGTLINLLDDENVKAVVGNYHDVTERKIAEGKIRVSNERFEMVSKATNDAVWDWNLQTDEIYWNEEVRSMFNYGAGDIATGTEWKKHIHPEDFTRVTRKILYHVKNHIQKWQDEYRFRCADDSYKYIFNRGFILFTIDNDPYRIIGAMQDVTEINKLQQSLNNERIKKQKELTNATIQGQEKERTEIGRELHDNINQLLTATKLYLDVAAKQPSMKDEMIKRSAENLSICMEEIRRLSSTLVPPSIGLNSFEEIIKDLLEPIKLATAINVDYEIIEVKKDMLTNNQQLNLYRIIQEHFNNILKHSKANNVFLGIEHIDGRINLKIKDDGQGFNISIKQKGIGFKNIQSRAELLNGKMEVVSKPGKGCLLEINFPVIHSNIDTTI